MCPVFNGCEDTALWIWCVQIRFLSVDTVKSEVYKEKVNTRDELVACIMDSAALIKQERQDYLRRATSTFAKRAEIALKSMVGFLNTYFELLQFINTSFVFISYVL